MPEIAPDFNHNQPVYSISEVSNAIKRVLEDHFGVVRLRGEVSGWKGAHSSGHAYFSLKDEGAVINAVCWKGTLSKLRQRPEEGLEVIATGRISAYNGKYQLVVEHIEAAGAGALMALLEKRRKMLEAEGLFDSARKKALPFLPRSIGVITSPTGAVIRDILHRIEDRFPLHVLVWPVAVQGEGAAEQIAAAIEGFNNMATPPDLLIVARGGGSIEDLWAFNEEIVVRAAANSRLPLISAVGHETDTTLIDYAADRRAPTPTAAAEMAVPVREELLLGVRQFDVRMMGAVQRSLAQRAEQLAGLARGLPRPAQLLENAAQRLDDWSERLSAALPQLLARKEQQLQLVVSGLRSQALGLEIQKNQQRLQELQQRLGEAVLRAIAQKQERLANFVSLLESLNYQRVLERGFALVKNAEGHVVSSAKMAAKEKELQLIFKDGAHRVKS